MAEPAPPLWQSAPAATSPLRVSDRVVGWLKGEVREFRDGAKREIEEFRSGYDKVRRGVRQLRSKISGD